MTFAVGERVFVRPCHALGEIVGHPECNGGTMPAYRVRLPNGAIIRFDADALIPFVGPPTPLDPEPKDAA